MATFKLGALLEAAASSSTELTRVRRLLDPKDTLRVLPLELTYREVSGDRIPRRVRLWNTYGYLVLEGEHWDHDGGRFWRETLPVCPISEAASLSIQVGLSRIEVGYTARLRDGGAEMQQQHYIRRVPIHWAIEEALTGLARSQSPGIWPEVREDQLALSGISRVGEVELWANPHDIVLTALRVGAADEDGVKAQCGEQRTFLKENLAGQAGTLSYLVQESRTAFLLAETFESHSFGHEITWRYPLFATPGQTRMPAGTFIPLDTINTLLEDQVLWSHWSWAPSTDPADLSSFCRGIHPTGEFTKIRNFLGADAETHWHDSINAACKWDLFALIASCSLNPKRNVQLSRRIRQSRVRTAYFKLFYNGGVLVGTLLKHAWAFGWAARPSRPVRCTASFRAVTGREREAISA